MEKEYTRRENMFALWICSLLVPVIVIITGRMMWKHCPKKINGVVGYRTKMSMINMDTWRFAHDHAGKLWWKVGIGLLGPTILIHIPFYGASDDTIGYAKQYLGIVSVGIPFLIVSNSFSNIIRADGNAGKAMLGVVLGNLANIILDPVMILGFGWNVAGAAVATVIGNIVSTVVYLSHLVSDKTMLSIKPSDYKATKKIVGGVFAIGVPASLNNILMSSSNIVINNMMSRFNDMAVAGLGVAMKVNMIVVMLLIGLGTGIQPLLGFCFGAGNKKRYMSILKFSLMLAFGLSAVMTVLCYSFAAPLVSAFLENQDAFTYGFSFSRIYIYSGPILGILFVLVNAIQSTGAALPSLILSISRQGLVYLPLLCIFNSVFDSAKMLVLVQPVTDYIAVIMAAILFIFTMKKYFKNITE